MKQKFEITGMTCSACAAHIENGIKKLGGVESVSVNLLQNSMLVELDEQKITKADIIRAVAELGYSAAIGGESKPGAEKTGEEADNMKHRLILSFIFMLALFYISMGHMLGLPLPSFMHGVRNAFTFAFTQLLLTLPIIYLNFGYFTNGFKRLFKGSPNMDSLIALGSSAALVYGIFAIYMISHGFAVNDMSIVEEYSMDLYFESSGMILTLISLGKYLEMRSKKKTTDAVSALIDLTPKTAVILENGEEKTIPTSELKPGNIAVVRSGEAIPADGIIIEGSCSVDESAITGESIPSEKSVGEHVIGATINRSGYFKFKIEKAGEDTTLSQIIRLVEEAASTKAPISRLADKISAVFVPAVIAAAVIACAVWLLTGHTAAFSLSIGIAVLVISCPCALGLATPTAIMVGTGRAAQLGILIKSAEALEITHKVDTVVLDKTGTITSGAPEVTDVIICGGVSREELLALASAIEKMSEHPLAKAISEYYPEGELDASDFKAIPGEGVSGTVSGSVIMGGNLKMLKNRSIDVGEASARSAELAREGKTPLFFARDNKLIGIIALADTVKPTSKRAVAELLAMKKEVVMLTGDNESTARAVAGQLGITNIRADVLPQNKEEEIRRLQSEGKRVAMVGDGINDAPALARADVGLAVGAGTDIAIDSADVVLIKNDLGDVVNAIELSHAVIKNIRQNLFWAFFYNTLGIPVAAGVLYPALNIKLNPMLAAAAMSFSSVFVVTNALRLRLFKPPLQNTERPADKKQEKGAVKTMTRKIKIDGMMCTHCSGRVEQALNALEGVEAAVDLKSKTATVTADEKITDEALKKAVEDAGYTVLEIE